MKVIVRLFAFARQAAANGSLELNLEDEATIAMVRDELVSRVPQLAPLADNLRFAVNEDYAADDTIVKPDDEVACIPPVSGG